MEKFFRPSDLPYPQVYHTFKAKNKIDDKLNEYRIQDLPEELIEEALNILKVDFASEETFCVSKKVSQNEAVMNELCYFWRKRMERKLSIGCFMNDGSNELVGVAVMSVLVKGEKYDVMAEEETSQEFLAFINWLHDQHDVFEEYNVNKYLTSHAMCVKREHRYRGIATEMIKVRSVILKQLNVPVTSTICTVYGSQKAASKAGHKEGYKISYNDLQNKFPTFDFSHRNTDFVKVMEFTM